MGDRILERCRALTQERGWFLKIFIGGILFPFPVLNAIAFGFLMELIDDVRLGRPVQLPEWQNVGKLFMNGLPLSLLLMVLGLIYMPLSAVPVIGQLAGIAMGFFAPFLYIVVSYRMLETADWKEAVNIGFLVDIIQKKFKEFLPCLIAHIIASLLITALTMLAAFIALLTFCLLFPLPYLVFGCAYFYFLAAAYPIMTEALFMPEATEILEDPAPPAPEAVETAPPPSDIEPPSDTEARSGTEPPSDTEPPSSDADQTQRFPPPTE